MNWHSPHRSEVVSSEVEPVARHFVQFIIMHEKKKTKFILLLLLLLLLALMVLSSVHHTIS